SSSFDADLLFIKTRCGFFDASNVIGPLQVSIAIPRPRVVVYILPNVNRKSLDSRAENSVVPGGRYTKSSRSPGGGVRGNSRQTLTRILT
ncbi:hypothetical protein CERSUDRAFT_116428, partial [Gelatoporia subvermispora B]